MKGFEHWSETGSYKTLSALRDESWLEEKRAELPYFYGLQIRKGFGPRTPDGNTKSNRDSLKSHHENEEAQKK